MFIFKSALNHFVVLNEGNYCFYANPFIKKWCSLQQICLFIDILNDFSNAYRNCFTIKRCYDEIIQILFVKLKFNIIYITC